MNPPNCLDSGSFLATGDFVYRGDSPITVHHSEGPWLNTADGRSLLDLEAANGSAGLGYDASLLQQACNDVSKIATLPSFVESYTRVNLAKHFVQMFASETGLSGKVAFDLGGAQGIELALKIAKHNSSGTKIVVLEGAYHGRSIATSQLSCSQRYRDASPSAMMDVVRLPYPETTNNYLGLSSKDAESQLIRLANYILSNELSGSFGERSGPLALVIEPLLNVSGLVFPNPAYVRSVVDAVRRRGGVIIVDEIFTGLYRTGKQWGFMQHELEPDIVVASKALTNGIVPLSIVWAKDPLALPENFSPGTHSVTFGNTPLSMAVATRVLGRYQSLGINDTYMATYEDKLRYAVKNGLSGAKGVKNWQVVGGIARVVLENEKAFEYRQQALNLPIDITGERCDGVIFAATGLSKNTLALHPPYILDDNHFLIIEQSLHQLLS